MFSIGEIFRLLNIQRILIRHGMDEIVFATHLFRPIRFILYLLPWNWSRKAHASRAVRLRRVLEDLGPVFVKLGQQLSTRRDMLAEDIAEEFEKLQDSVKPFSGKEARAIIEKAYGLPIEEVFTYFEEKPLASASVAQVHSARLKDGRDVIVKVLRPDILKVIQRDIGILHFLSRQAERYSKDGEKLKPSNVVSEFEKTLLNELDLMREAANASQLRRNMADSDTLYIPEVDWELTRKNVMVMERIEGAQINDLDALRKMDVDLAKLAQTGVDLFFTQVFRDSYFHADMHPGNIFVSKDEHGNTRIILVDFGIMSSLSEFDQRYLAENFLAFLNKDYQRVAELHVESGWVPANTRVDEFEFAIRAVCEPLFDRPLRDISFGTLLLRLFQTARRFNMVIMPQLILLQKTLINIEGLGRELYPDLNLWEAAKPAMEQWMRDRVGVRGLLKGTQKNIPYWVDRLPELPNKMVDLIEKTREGKLQINWYSEEMEQFRQEVRNDNNRKVFAILASGFVTGAAVIYGFSIETPTMLWDIPVVSWVFGVFGIGMAYFAFRK